LRGSRVRGQHLAHDPLGRHHSHTALHANARSLIHKHDSGVGASARADDACRQRPRHRALLERLQSPCPIRCLEFRAQEPILQLQLADFLLQAPVLVPGIYQQKVVFNHPDGVLANELHDARQRRHCGDGPYPDEPDILPRLHLPRKQNKLCQYHQQQRCHVAIAAEQEVHLKNTPLEKTDAGRARFPPATRSRCAEAV
jgi:hypothetical protein